MTTMWETNTVTVAELLKHITKAEIALPQFQRPAIWTKGDWIPFLATVLRDRPAGTLLFLETGGMGAQFVPRPLEGAPTLGNTNRLKWLLLDGQQRTTTIYRAFDIGFSGNSGPVKEIVLNVKRALERGHLEDDDLDLVARSKVKGAPAMAKGGKISLKTLIDAPQLTAWERTYADTHIEATGAGQARLVALLGEVIPGFRTAGDYRFPVLEIDEAAPLDVVVDIFEDMNRRGQRLNQFDLMVARLYVPLVDGTHYDLRSRWNDCLTSSTHLRNLAVDEADGMLPLQLIAMQVSRLPPGAKPEKVRGLGNKDVLELPPNQIVGEPVDGQLPKIAGLSLEAAVKALDEAGGFLTSKCGVTCRPLLPQLSMLLPIADQFLRPPAERLSDQQMKSWFFASGLSIHYYGSVTSYADRDCKALSSWADSGGTDVPAVVSSFDRRAAESLNLLQPMSREGAVLGSALMALLVSAGALDWRAGQMQVASLRESVEFHHMIPEQTLKKYYKKKEERRPIALMTPITASRNSAIRDQNPGQVMNALGKNARPILATHYADEALLVAAPETEAGLINFLDSRQTLLRKFVVRALGL